MPPQVVPVPSQVVPVPSQVVAVRALARAARILERVSCPLTLAHYRVLCAIEAGDERASRVAERLAMGKPAVSAAVDALCQRGWLVRAGVGDDLRATALSVTGTGRDVLRSAEETMAGWLSELCARTADPAGTVAALAGLAGALDQLSAERHGGARR
ncbi:MAG TPA: MarR family winged helix-turn-helix transcriptional regulator [Acidimicrobiales bacterium]|nr:MarR family winged helix-turn-helix transcriptional regulator [Acidimicrobiales bacterium]